MGIKQESIEVVSMITSKGLNAEPVILSLCCTFFFIGIVFFSTYGLSHGAGQGTLECIRAGSPIEVGMLADYTWDRPHEFSQVITVLSGLAVIFVPLAERSKSNLKLVALELAGLALIPWSVHLIGTFAVNNMGAIAGGL